MGVSCWISSSSSSVLCGTLCSPVSEALVNKFLLKISAPPVSPPFSLSVSMEAALDLPGVDSEQAEDKQ